MKREYPICPIVGVGVVILKNGRIILVKRRVEPGKDRWSIPGGSVRLRERVLDAAIREAKEESGLDIEIIDQRPLDVYDHIIIDEKGHTQYHFTSLEFLAKHKGGALKAADDAADARWISLEEVERYDLTNSFRTFFQKHKEKLMSLSSSG